MPLPMLQVVILMVDIKAWGPRLEGWTEPQPLIISDSFHFLARKKYPMLCLKDHIQRSYRESNPIAVSLQT